MGKQYYVYIMINKSGTLYTGMTNNLKRRLLEHKEISKESSRWWKYPQRQQHKELYFTHRYNINKLVYYKIFDNPEDAIVHEKQIKGWLRKKKIRLIQSVNPKFRDLNEDI